jgi:hypothetical protein
MERGIILPTIELVSLGNTEVVKFEEGRYPFQVIQETKLESHRGLFNDYLLNQKGVILHLGNIDSKEDGFYFASDLIDWDFEPGLLNLPNFEKGEDGSGQSERFKFQPEYLGGLKELLFLTYSLSPEKTAYFLTDYQFGPSEGKYKKLKSLDEFWSIHDLQGLDWNVLYKIG